MTEPDRRRSAAALWFVLPGLAILMALGTWQLDRLAWKSDLIERLQVRRTAEPVPLPQDLNAQADRGLEFLPRHLLGRMLDIGGAENRENFF